MLKIGIECESIEGKNPIFGVGRIIMKLLEEISRRPELKGNYKFILYFKDKVPDFDFLQNSIFEIKLTPVPFFKNRLFPIYYFLLLPIRLWFDRPNIMFWPNYMLPIIAFGKSLVLLTEDVYYETYTGKLPFQYRLAYGIFAWWAAKFADKIIAISKTSKDNLVKLYKINPNKISVNYLGVDFIKYQGQNLKKQNPYLLFVGQMFPRRHVKEVILAFKKLLTEHENELTNLKMNNLNLILVGPDKYEIPTINPLISEINKQLKRVAIIHKDYVSNEKLAQLYTKAKALIYVSDKEAFGLPPMEALSFGIPPIVMDNNLGHELFDKYAFFVNGSNEEEITNNISNIFYYIICCKNPTITEKIEKIRKFGPEFVKKYNWKNFTDRFIENLN